MQSFLAKCAAVGIVAGGFTLTGDLGRLAERGRKLVEATGVPADRTVGEDQPGGSAAGPASPPPAAASERPAPAAPAPAPAAKPWRLPGDAPADAPVGRPVAVVMPASGGVDAVDLRRVTAGGRLLVWVRRPDAAGGGQAGTDMLALDLIDPTTGEALEHRHAAISTANRGPVHAAPRRVLVAVDATGRLSRGDMLRLTPIRGVHGSGSREEIGRVLALEVKAP